MGEWQLFEKGTIPEWTTPEWYAEREAAPHLEQEGHRERLLLTADFVNDALNRLGYGGVFNSGNGGVAAIDLGAGDGGLLSLVQDRWHGEGVFGYDLQQTNVDAAKARGVIVELRNAVTDIKDIVAFEVPDVWIATEFLEHLVDPHGFVRSLSRSAAGYLVASSPYTETAGSHYEYHTWAWDLAGYKKMLEDNGWRVVRQETAWISQVLLAERV